MDNDELKVDVNPSDDDIVNGGITASDEALEEVEVDDVKNEGLDIEDDLAEELEEEYEEDEDEDVEMDSYDDKDDM